MSKTKKSLAVKRGDTIVEVVFAFAIFCMVATISIAMMNLGISASERSLELVTARNELNAQAEALRFIHSSYIAELSLPTCGAGASLDTKCQQYLDLWKEIKEHSVPSDKYSIIYPPDAAGASGGVKACDSYYKENLLRDNDAFVLNTRQLLAQHNKGNGTSYRDSDALIYATTYDDDPDVFNVFEPASLNARIIYGAQTATDSNENSTNTTQSFLTDYTRVMKVEGIWVVAVRGPTSTPSAEPDYYDFYIETCWYGAGNAYPTALDTIIRLYNPQGAN